MDLPLSLRRGGIPLYEQIRAQILALVERGRLPPGARLPPVRTLARQAGVHFLTVHRAYRALARARVVEVAPRLGVFVAAAPPEKRRRLPAAPPSALARPPASGVLALVGYRNLGEKAVQARPLRAVFDVWQGDPALFPAETWRRLSRRHAWRPLTLPGRLPERGGNPRLLEALCAETLPARGVRAVPGEICLASGGVQAIDLLLSYLLHPGDRVVVEEPGSVEIRQIVRYRGCVPVPVPVDADGIDPDALRAAIRRSSPRAVLLTAACQFPTTAPMGLSRRRAVLEACAGRPIWVIEDDVDGEFHYDAPPAEALKSLDRTGQVILVKSFSKSVDLGIGVGFAVAPPAVAAGVRLLMSRTGQRHPFHTQELLAGFIGEGHYEEHLRRLRKVYMRRRDLLAGLLRRLVPGLAFRIPTGGTRLWARLPAGVDGPALSERLLARGVFVPNGRLYFERSPRRDFLHLGFARPTEPEIESGVREIRRVLRR